MCLDDCRNKGEFDRLSRKLNPDAPLNCGTDSQYKWQATDLPSATFNVGRVSLQTAIACWHRG